RIVRREGSKADAVEDVASVVEGRETQPLLERYRDSQFRIEDRQLCSARWNADERARRRIGGFSASGNRPLWTGSVQRKPAQCTTTAGEEPLAEWNMTSG